MTEENPKDIEKEISVVESIVNENPGKFTTEGLVREIRLTFMGEPVDYDKDPGLKKARYYITQAIGKGKIDMRVKRGDFLGMIPDRLVYYPCGN